MALTPRQAKKQFQAFLPQNAVVMARHKFVQPQEAQSSASPSAVEDLLDHEVQVRQQKLASTYPDCLWGAGPAQPGIAIVGDCPGSAEKHSHLPFQGEQGLLLEKMLAAIGLSRASVYLTYLFKVPDLTTRSPLPPDQRVTAEFLDFLSWELRQVQPQLVLVLGELTVQAICESTRPLSELRGHWHRWSELKWMGSHDLQSLIQQPALKREAWEDLKKLASQLNLSGSK